MNPHGIKVFDRADDDAVVVFITHHFHLVLFPANQRLINQQLIGWRQIEAALANLFKLFAVVSDTATGAAHGKRRTNDARETDLLRYRQRFFHGVRDTGTCGIQADALHRHVEAATVFSFINRIGGGTNHGHAKLGQHTLALQLQRTVQRGLTTHGRQHRIRALFFNDFTHHFPVDRLDVGRIRHFRVGHDGGRVGVHQNDAVTLFTQRFTRLRT